MPEANGAAASAESHTPEVHTDPQAVARQAAADQRLQELQGQLAGMQGQLGQVTGELMRRNQVEFESQLNLLPPAERAERKAELVAQHVGQLQRQLQQSQIDQSQKAKVDYFERKSRELETEINGAQGLAGADRVTIADVPPHLVADQQQGERLTREWMTAEAARRARTTDRRGVDPDDETPSPGRAERKQLAEAGVTGPVGARPAAGGGPDEADIRRLANTELGPRDLPQGTRLKRLRDYREQVYAAAGLAAPVR